MIQVPVDRFRAIVERWLEEYVTAGDGYAALAASSNAGADAWRFRLSEGFKQSGGFLSRGWFTYQAIQEDEVDEFLTAADLVDLWYSELADLRPVESGNLKWCPQCQMWLSIKAFPKHRRTKDGLYGWCGACKSADTKRRTAADPERVREADRQRYRSGNKKPGRPGRSRPWKAPRLQSRRRHAKMTREQVVAAHALYRAGRSVPEIAGLIYERFGYRSPRSCEHSLRESFHRDGLAVRSKSEAQLLRRAA